MKSFVSLFVLLTTAKLASFDWHWAVEFMCLFEQPGRDDEGLRAEPVERPLLHRLHLHRALLHNEPRLTPLLPPSADGEGWRSVFELLAVVYDTFANNEKAKFRKLYMHKLEACERALELLQDQSSVAPCSRLWRRTIAIPGALEGGEGGED